MVITLVHPSPHKPIGNALGHRHHGQVGINGRYSWEDRRISDIEVRGSSNLTSLIEDSVRIVIWPNRRCARCVAIGSDVRPNVCSQAFVGIHYFCREPRDPLIGFGHGVGLQYRPRKANAFHEPAHVLGVGEKYLRSMTWLLGRVNAAQTRAFHCPAAA